MCCTEYFDGNEKIKAGERRSYSFCSYVDVYQQCYSEVQFDGDLRAGLFQIVPASDMDEMCGSNFCVCY